MSDIIALIVLGIAVFGIIAYGVVMCMAAKAIHDTQEIYYDYLKRGGGQPKYLADYYKKGDV